MSAVQSKHSRHTNGYFRDPVSPQGSKQSQLWGNMLAVFPYGKSILLLNLEKLWTAAAKYSRGQFRRPRYDFSDKGKFINIVTYQLQDFINLSRIFFITRYNDMLKFYV